MPTVTLVTSLPFPLELAHGDTLTNVGDAVIYFSHLSAAQRAKHYWERAVQMFNIAVNEAAYLRTATINLETALRMEGFLADAPPAAHAIAA